MRPNTALRAWREGRSTVGAWLAINSSYSAEVMAHVGFDWLCLDMQHGVVDNNDIVPMMQGISTTDTIPFVRVNWNDPAAIMNALDAGAYGIVIQLVNNATVDEPLLAFLESDAGGNLLLTDAEKLVLHPRIRLRARVSFTDGSNQTIELVDGSTKLVEARFSGIAEPDLTGNTLTNAVVLCDVARVDLAPGSDVEVFIPVQVTTFEAVPITNDVGVILDFLFLARFTVPPSFQPLRVDTVDRDGNIIIVRNLGTRDVPSPVFDIVCGSVITIVIDGVLSVPFLRQGGGAPSFDQDNQGSVAGLGGRYRISVTAN